MFHENGVTYTIFDHNGEETATFLNPSANDLTRWSLANDCFLIEEFEEEIALFEPEGDSLYRYARAILDERVKDLERKLTRLELLLAE